MKTITCDFCGGDESLSQSTMVGEYEICGDCQWAGVTADQIRRVRNQPERIVRNEAEAKAHVGLWH